MARRRRRLLIDGMNVIGSRPDRWWNDPDRAIRRLIAQLDEFAAATGDDISVVFDRRPRDLREGRHGDITVAFAHRRGRNAADHEIVDMVGGDEEPRSITVVTSDGRLVERVRELGARVTSSGTFRRRLDETVPPAG
jgi:predicted RNA-binding protein with PIN domain